MKKRRNARPVPTNADLNVGRTANIIEPVTPNQPGRARLDLSLIHISRTRPPE